MQKLLFSLFGMGRNRMSCVYGDHSLRALNQAEDPRPGTVRTVAPAQIHRPWLLGCFLDFGVQIFLAGEFAIIPSISLIKSNMQSQER